MEKIGHPHATTLGTLACMVSIENSYFIVDLFEKNADLTNIWNTV